MLSLAWKEITRRTSRAALAIAGFLLVALLIAAAQCLGDAIRRATSEPLDVTGADLVVIRKVIPCAFAPVKRPKDLGAITGAELERIRALKSVKNATGTLVVWAFDGGQPTVTTGVLPGSVKEGGPLRQYRDGERCCVLEEGRLFDPSKNETVLDRGYAEQRGLGIGDMVRLGPRDFSIVGILKVAGVAVIGGGEAYAPLRRVQEMLEEGDVYDYLFISARSGVELAALTTEVEEIIGEGCQVSSQDSLPGQISQS
ncbi:MAG: ABC transporter permease, partial [Lentisphaeria bacterium]|nr:ABC transporter permease [Lentisphaeria bacterium]